MTGAASSGASRNKPASADAPSSQGSVADTALRCLMCKGTQHRVAFTESGVDILQCTDCGHVFSSYRGSAHFTEYWGNEVPAGEHFYWSKARRRMHADFFRRFIEGRSGRLLDMGSGLGFFVKAMSKYPDWEAYGCEISPAAVRFAHSQLGLTNVQCNQLHKADLPEASIDIITIWDVIDHLLHPDPVISRCNALLKNNGILFIRTPNITVQLPRARLGQALSGSKDKKYLQAKDHYHHYSTSSIRKLLERNGFGKVSFIHLHPIGSPDPKKAPLVDPLKNASFHAIRTLAVCSGGQLNFDNLFVVAQKGPAVPSG